ncbi:hypothetical protein [Undibacterium sp. Ren11W]|uniref:hypothetical protein n=1 Tax=Undibacterium sp. Ren11W TaxID=3413045 RepID=UPI003BF04078
MRNKLILLWLFVSSALPAWAQISVRIGVPGIDIGINLPLYPELMPVPGYPVYYAPQLNSNYFFYDGMYWVFQDDNWYASSWYNGPWSLVDQELVPVFVLRIPVRYYRQSPHYFRGWRPDAPPRWGEHWGAEWQQRHHGWDKWNRSMPAARPPLPVYQRNYTGARYPQLKEQQSLQNKNYRYQPHDPIVRQHVQELRKHATSLPAPSAPIENQARPQPKSAEINSDTHDGRDSPRTMSQDNSRDNSRDHPRDNASDKPRDQERNTAPTTAPNTPPGNPRISAPPPAQPRQQAQPPRAQTQQPDQRQQPARAQHPDNPPPHQAAPQDANRPQKPEHQQERERPNERAKDHENDRSSDRGNDRNKERNKDRDDERSADHKK